MPPRNEKVQLEYPNFNQSKGIKRPLIIAIAGACILGILLTVSIVLAYQSGKKAQKKEEAQNSQVLGAETTATSTPRQESAPSTSVVEASPSPTPTKNLTPDIPPSEKRKTFEYPYLGIKINYAENWKVEVSNSNIQGKGFKFDCKDKVTTNNFLRDVSACTNDEIEPQNLIITGPNKERIVLWNAVRVEDTCPSGSSFKIIILGSLKTFIPDIKDGRVSPCYGIMFTPNGKSIWKMYRIDFDSTPKQYDEVQRILESIEYM